MDSPQSITSCGVWRNWSYAAREPLYGQHVLDLFSVQLAQPIAVHIAELECCTCPWHTLFLTLMHIHVPDGIKGPLATANKPAHENLAPWQGIFCPARQDPHPANNLHTETQQRPRHWRRNKPAHAITTTKWPWPKWRRPRNKLLAKARQEESAHTHNSPRMHTCSARRPSARLFVKEP